MDNQPKKKNTKMHLEINAADFQYGQKLPITDSSVQIYKIAQKIVGVQFPVTNQNATLSEAALPYKKICRHWAAKILATVCVPTSTTLTQFLSDRSSQFLANLNGLYDSTVKQIRS